MMTSEKTPVYCLPGTMCNQRLWQALTIELPAHIQLIHIAIPEGRSISDIAEKLLHLLPQQPINLLGFSLGGYLASYLSCYFPERIKKLLVVSNTPTQLPDSELLIRRQTLAWLEKNHYLGLPSAKAKSLLDPDNAHPDLVKCLQVMDKELGADTLKWQLTATTERQDLLPKLIQNQKAVHFYLSKHDPLNNQQWLTQAVDLENITVHLTQGVGHMLPLEKPEELANIIIEWTSLN